jgi:hydrogenase nickel incorporation protein HypA/HybF
VHELPVTQGILDVSLEAARGAGARRILVINLVVGNLSSIVDDSVQFYFDILSRGTPAEGATLRFQRQPATALCRDCGHEFEATIPLTPACPSCGSARLEISGGREFRVESIEVDDGSSGSS